MINEGRRHEFTGGGD
uniref:Uncharacterized protein n=1 Tax=Arundo donax TaxID=35708 RepID=A0A0A9FR75_ARUDO